MGLILLMIVCAALMCLPVKCYSDGQYKIKCLEHRGVLIEKGADYFCDLSGHPDDAKNNPRGNQ